MSTVTEIGTFTRASALRVLREEMPLGLTTREMAARMSISQSRIAAGMVDAYRKARDGWEHVVREPVVDQPGGAFRYFYNPEVLRSPEASPPPTSKSTALAVVERPEELYARVVFEDEHMVLIVDGRGGVIKGQRLS